MSQSNTDLGRCLPVVDTRVPLEFSRYAYRVREHDVYALSISPNEQLNMNCDKAPVPPNRQRIFALFKVSIVICHLEDPNSHDAAMSHRGKSETHGGPRHCFAFGDDVPDAYSMPSKTGYLANPTGVGHIAPNSGRFSGTGSGVHPDTTRDGQSGRRLRAMPRA